jgi:GNAT superfamily N-acetyltransferase
MTQRDVRAVAELKEQWAALPGPASPEQRRRFAEILGRWIDRQGASLIARVADHQGELVGMAWLVAFERVPNIDQTVRLTGDIQSVYVAPAYRGAGVGRALVASLLEAADARGIERITVSANHAAAPLYVQLGFRSDDLLLERRRPPAPGLGSPWP